MDALERRHTLSRHVLPSGAPFPGWSHGLMAAMDRLTITSLRPPRGQLAGPVLSRELGRALEFADYRAYAAGDDPKLVDWRAYNRLDRLYLKQYREERARTIGVLIDASASLDWGQAEAHKGTYARRMAASLAWIALGHLERVQVFALRNDRAEPVPAPVGRPGAAALFKMLAALREEGPVQLAAAVGSALRQMRGQGPVVLISDLFDADWQPALRAIAARNQGGVILQVLSPDEWDPPLGDEVELEDSETGELRQTRFGPSELSEYRHRLTAFVAEVADLSRRVGVRHVALNSGDSLADAVLQRLPAAGVLQ